MPLFNKKKKKEEVVATPEEQASMERAEAMASNIGKEQPTDTGFNQEENNKKVQNKIEQERANPLVTVVQGAEPGKSSVQKQQTFTQEQVANSIPLQNLLNNSKADEAANAVAQEGYANAKTQEDIDKVAQDVDAARKLGEVESANAQSALFNSMSGALNTMGNEEKTQMFNNAQSQLINQLGQEPEKPSYTGTTNTGEVQKDVAAIGNSIPSAVIEKLGIQDYYPQANKDIAVGNFTGSRIGSQTIYSGAGALLPMGLYDARKRALAEAAKAKQALVDKYDDIIETAPQYQEKFNEANAEWFNQMWSKHKGNADSFLNDPEVRKEHARRLGLGKELKNYGEQAEKILTDAKNKENYVTEEMVQNALDIKSALVKNADDVVSGKLDLGPLFAKAQVYQNMIPQLDTMLKQAYSESALGGSPINFRTGGEFDSKKFMNERNDFLTQVKTGDINRKDFVTGFKRFFTGDYEKSIKALVASGKYSEEQYEAALDYFAGQMQEQVKLDHKLLDSKAVDWAALNERKRQFDMNYDRMIKEGKTHWRARREEMNFTDAKTGKPIAQLIQDYKNQGLKGDKLNNAILEAARRNGISNAVIDPYTNSLVIKEQASTFENEKPKRVNNSAIWVNIKEQIVENGKKKWVYSTVKAQDLQKIDLSKRKLAFEDNTHITPEIQKNISKAIKENSLSMRVNSYDLGYGYADASKNDIVTVNPSNIDKYDSKKMVLLKKNKGKLSTVSIGEDGKPIYSNIPGTFFVKGEFTSDSGVNAHDENWGQGIKSESGFGLGQGPMVESGSYSSSSGEE